MKGTPMEGTPMEGTPMEGTPMEGTPIPKNTKWEEIDLLPKKNPTGQDVCKDTNKIHAPNKNCNNITYQHEDKTYICRNPHFGENCRAKIRWRRTLLGSKTGGITVGKKRKSKKRKSRKRKSKKRKSKKH